MAQINKHIGRNTKGKSANYILHQGIRLVSAIDKKIKDYLNKGGRKTDKTYQLLSKRRENVKNTYNRYLNNIENAEVKKGNEYVGFWGIEMTDRNDAIQSRKDYMGESSANEDKKTHDIVEGWVNGGIGNVPKVQVKSSPNQSAKGKSVG